MRHSFATALAVATVGAAAATGQAPPTSEAAKPRLDIPFSTAVVTPHVPWATSLPGGPIAASSCRRWSAAETWSS